MVSLKDVPPHVRRELLRHVSRTPLKAASQKAAEEAASSSKTSRWVVGGCIAVVATTASFPLLAKWWIKPLYGRQEPLTEAQNRRGPFQNPGSKDVGPDPDYDVETATHKYEKGHGEDEYFEDDEIAAVNVTGKKI